MGSNPIHSSILPVSYNGITLDWYSSNFGSIPNIGSNFLGRFMQPIILALSSFRNSKDAIDLAIRLAEKSGNLIICYITDENIHRYLEDSPCYMREELKEEYIQSFKKKNELRAISIKNIAEEYDIKNVEIVAEVGRFAEIVLEVADIKQPEYIVTTRSTRLDILRRMFGSPIDVIKNNARCKVMEL